MFPVKAKSILPVEKVVIHSVAVRGQLGNLTVWVSNQNIAADDEGQYAFRLSPRHWTKVYEKKHKASQRAYQKLDLSGTPIVIQPGKVRVIYVHSSLPGDEAIVYDNTATNIPWAAPGPPRVEDNFISIHTGKAHLSPIPFNQSPIWGWGNAWVRAFVLIDCWNGCPSYSFTVYLTTLFLQRDRREYVGQINYGVTYKLWNPERHNLFGTNFHKATNSVLALQRRYESPMSLLPDECVYYILNMCRWDWFEDDGRDMKRRARIRKQRLRALEAERQEQQEQGDDTMHDAANVSNEDEEDDTAMETAQEGAAAQGWAVQLVQQQLGLDADDSDEGEEEDEDDESDEESVWERANGYRADNVAFSFRDVSSDEESEADDDEEQNDAPARLQWLRGRLGGRIFPHFNRRRQHVVVDDDSDDSDDSDFVP